LVRKEVERIYVDIGLNIVWQDEHLPRPQVYEARAYILRQLPPSLRRLFPTYSGRAGLAITLGSSPQRPSPDIYISKRAVLEMAGDGRRLPRKLVARALGRTLAHELGHRFLRAGHTKTGILKPILRKQELLKPTISDLQFTENQARELRLIAYRGVLAVTEEHAPIESVPKKP
jgi:hypothetical protein